MLNIFIKIGTEASKGDVTWSGVCFACGWDIWLLELVWDIQRVYITAGQVLRVFFNVSVCCSRQNSTQDWWNEWNDEELVKGRGRRFWCGCNFRNSSRRLHVPHSYQKEYDSAHISSCFVDWLFIIWAFWTEPLRRKNPNFLLKGNDIKMVESASNSLTQTQQTRTNHHVDLSSYWTTNKPAIVISGLRAQLVFEQQDCRRSQQHLLHLTLCWLNRIKV